MKKDRFSIRIDTDLLMRAKEYAEEHNTNITALLSEGLQIRMGESGICPYIVIAREKESEECER